MDEELKQKICIKCQWCCKHVYLPIEARGANISFSAARGIEIRFDGMKPYAILEQTCQHLTEKGCGIYQDRPFACQNYDGRRDKFHSEMCQWKGL